ncbi:hypothetical protein F503_00868 [Ophiostoma piceae UAMH 11346]|uniref:Uncharacterized protein n=1 Tax=Ophiostoma piceae (strain UAMH 11346) TaxID=1262450 RepID=S3D3Y6_OPHP1|nr:hypothetical protein F503_00868 [Ophiostoma piceae UAMH 11346]
MAASTDKPIIRKRPIIGRSHAAGVSASQKGQPASTRPLGVIFVSSKTPFMSVVNRSVKVLDRGPGGARWSSTKVAPLLADRIAKAQARDIDALPTQGKASDWRTARQREVLLLATGHAISKLVLIAGWFRRQQGYVVTVRTRWAATVDDIFTFEGADDETEEGDVDDDVMDIDAGKEAVLKELRKSTRVRTISCLEVAIRLK